MAQSDCHPSIDILTEFLEESSAGNWNISKSTLGGRGLFATQPIKQGTLIFSNKPLALGPRDDHVDDFFCTVCYQVIPLRKICDKCQLKICSKHCEQSEHHIKECNFITANWNRKPNHDKYSEALSRVLIHLRLLLLNPDNKLSLDLYQKDNNELFESEEIKTLCNNYDIPLEHIQYMTTFNSIIKINTFRVASNIQKNNIRIRGFYPVSAFLNHSCIPNTRNVFDENYKMSVYASKDIDTEEEILTCYTGLLWSTPTRLLQLYMTKQFWCKCNRCKDRTEKGTKLSALKCVNKNCSGLILPVSPTDLRSQWQCDKCSSKISHEQISTIQSILGSLVGTLDLDNRFNLENIILQRLSQFTPYCNHIFVDLRLRLALKIGEDSKLNGICNKKYPDLL